MFRPQFFGKLLTGAAFLGMTFVWHAEAGEAKKDSTTKVKATARATRPDANGKQTVTITLDIEKDWHIFGNPVGSGPYENCRTIVAIDSEYNRAGFLLQKKLTANVKYPPGKLHVEGKDQLSIYEGRAVIQVEVLRTVNDSSPLEVNIDLNACNEGSCLPRGTIKLIVR
jgi:hypothetical protein